MNKKNNYKEDKTKRIVPSLTKPCEDTLPFVEDIRASWIANKSHCDVESPSRRDHYIMKKIDLCPKWLGELGFIRYYLFHIDNGYVSGKSKLIRIDENKGFNPDNCKIVDKPKKKPMTAKSKKNQEISIFTEHQSINPATLNITNNYMMFSDELRLLVIKELLKNIGVTNITFDEKKGIIFLKSIDNEQ